MTTIPVRSSNQIYLHSSDADFEFGDDQNKNYKLRFNLDQPIHVGPEYKLEVSLLQFNSPVSWGNMTDHNNTFTINGNTLNLNTGDYNIDEIVSALNTKFNPAVSFSYNLNTSKITFDITENYYTVPSGQTFTFNGTEYTIPAGNYTSTSALAAAIDNAAASNFHLNWYIGTTNTQSPNQRFFLSGPTDFTFSTSSKIFEYFGFTFSDNEVYTASTVNMSDGTPHAIIEATLEKNQLPQYLSGTMLKTLGITTSTVYVRHDNTSANTGTVTIATNIFDLSGYPYLVINSNFNTRNISSHRKRRTKVLAVVPIENNSYVSFHGTGFRFLSDLQDIFHIDIEILTPDHQPVNFRGAEFSLTLQFDYLPIN